MNFVRNLFKRLTTMISKSPEPKPEPVGPYRVRHARPTSWWIECKSLNNTYQFVDMYFDPQEAINQCRNLNKAHQEFKEHVSKVIYP